MEKRTAIKVLLVLAVLVASSLTVFLQVSGSENDTRATRAVAPTDTFLEVDWDDLPSVVYVGDPEVSFTFDLHEEYDGEAYDDTNGSTYSGGVEGWIYDAKVTLSSDAPITPIDMVADYSAYNPVDTPANLMFGQNFSDDSDDYYSDADYNEFNFSVNTDDVLVGDEYHIFIDVSYKMVTGFNWLNLSAGYNYTSHSERLEIQFEVRTCLLNDIDPIDVMDFTSGSGSGGSIYAGVKMQKIGIRAASDGAIPNSLTNVSITMIIPTSGETQGITLTASVPNKDTAFNKRLFTTYLYFYYYVDVDKMTKPGDKNGAYLLFQYEREINDQWVLCNEVKHYNVIFKVAFTPYLDVPEHFNGTVPMKTFDQAELAQMTQTLRVNFTNNGNVDLQDIKVTMYLTQSIYFDENIFYSLETNGYSNSDMDQEILLGSMKIGETKFADFNVNIFRHLPPGQYALQIRYTAKYYNDGSTGQPTQMVSTSYSDYTTIKDYTGWTSLFYDYPYAIVGITDENGIDCYGYTGTYNPGTKGTTMSITVINKELYGIKDVSATLDGNGYLHDPVNGNDTGIPLAYYASGVNNQPDVQGYSPNYNQQYGGTYWSYSSRTFYFFVDINDPIAVTYGWLNMTLKGFNYYNKPVEQTIPILITFLNGQPSLIVSEAYSPSNLNPGDDFVYTVTLSNVGDSPARNVQVLLRDTTDILSVTNPIQNITYLGVGESKTLTYSCHLTDKAMPMDQYTQTYSLYVYYGYTDERGQVYPLSNSGSNVYLRTSPLPKVDPVQAVTPTFSSDQSQILAYMVIAIGIVIAAVVLMFGMARLSGNVNKWRYEDRERKDGPKESKPEPKPEPKKEAPKEEPKEPEAGPIDAEVEEEGNSPPPPEEDVQEKKGKKKN